VHAKASTESLSVGESDRTPSTLVLRANFPVACQAVGGPSNGPINCWIKMRVDSREGSVAVRQRAIGKAPCLYFIYEENWDNTTKTATGYTLEVVAKVIVKVACFLYVHASRSPETIANK